MKDELTPVDIGNYCLLVEKYKSYLIDSGAEYNYENNKMLLEGCSKIVSDQLKIMDDCQKMLYEHGYSKENIEKMKTVRDLFKEGVETMQNVLSAFEIAIGKIPD